MFSIRQQNRSPCNSPRQRKLKSAGVGPASPASPSIADLVQLSKLGILSRSEIRELILRGTPSPPFQRQSGPDDREHQHDDQRAEPAKADHRSWAVYASRLLCLRAIFAVS